MIKKVQTKAKGWKIHTQLMVLILLTGLASILLFEVLWLNKWDIYEYVQQVPGLRDMSQDEEFWEKLRTEAANYNIPSSEDDKEGIKKIQPFLSQGDKYTGIYIYNLKEGTYVAGKFPSVLNNAAFSTFFDMGYQLTGGEGEETYEFPMKFKNGYATVMVWFYHRVRFIYPYCIFCLTVSIGLFFGVILFFIKKKMNMVASLKDEILRMAAGNLRDSVPEMGQDEIGIIAEELDNLRTALQDTLVREKESRRANQDLITAMSHDYLAMSRQADREGYPEIAEAYKRYAWEEAEHASKFAELIGEVVWDTKTNLYKRMNAESGACEDKMRLARMAKEQNLDAVHDTVHEMAKDEARHGKGFEGLYKRYFGK